MNNSNPYQAAINYQNADKLHKNQYQAAKALLNQLFFMARFAEPEVIKPLLPVIEQIEYAMQEACGFDKDSKKHRWWMEIPGCTCPYEDNMDMFGTGYRIYAEDCPYHGHLESTNQEAEEALREKIRESMSGEEDYWF